ncbi:hypothetical protein [Mycolicibacterium sp. CBMA 295]|uniref:hypothetical protein n=1 Tax=Mycolicibacterium sp. CBMA 295 TaxID=2606605 RepID=UPI0012DDCFBB|nr:hypothetical protein [Mycolicibacterium sp. CBMA 295]MUM27783.1 hypothetical protein [Mycolicibacterium sp. CBMA 295]
MRPTVCPRCTSTITAEQQAAETEKHECSLCSKGLGLGEADATTTAAESGRVVGQGDAPVDEVDALEAAVEDGKYQIEALGIQITAKKDQLASAEAKSVAGMAQIAAAEERRTLELDLARAEGALAVFNGPSGSLVDDPVDETVAAVLSAADTVLVRSCGSRSRLPSRSSSMGTLRASAGIRGSWSSTPRLRRKFRRRISQS